MPHASGRSPRKVRKMSANRQRRSTVRGCVSAGQTRFANFVNASHLSGASSSSTTTSREAIPPTARGAATEGDGDVTAGLLVLYFASRELTAEGCPGHRAPLPRWAGHDDAGPRRARRPQSSLSETRSRYFPVLPLLPVTEPGDCVEDSCCLRCAARQTVVERYESIERHNKRTMALASVATTRLGRDRDDEASEHERQDHRDEGAGADVRDEAPPARHACGCSVVAVGQGMAPASLEQNSVHRPGCEERDDE